MAGEEACQVCQEPYGVARPLGLRFGLSALAIAVGGSRVAFTGPGEVLRQDYAQDQALSQYKSDLEVMQRCCLYCRILSRKFDHTPQACSHRFHWILI